MNSNSVLIIILLLLPVQLSAQSQVDRELKKMANELLAQLGESERNDVVVDVFLDVEKEKTPLGTHLTSKFFSTFFKASIGQYNLLERDDFERLNEEIRLGDMEILEYNEKLGYGKIRGADLVITGSYTYSDNYINLSLRVVQLETSRFIGATDGRLLLTPSLRRLLGIQETTTAQGYIENTRSATKTDSRNKPTARRGATASFGPLAVTTQGCQQSGSNIICKLMLTSKGRESNLSLYSSNTVLQGANGVVLQAFSVKLNNKSGNSRVSQILRADQAVSAEVIFRTNGNRPSNATLQLKSFISGQEPFFITIENAF